MPLKLPVFSVVVELVCLTLCDPVDCSPLGSSVHGISQSRILRWVAIPFSSRSSRPRDLRWSWYNNNRNKVHNKCHVLDSSPKHLLPLPPHSWSVEELSSMKVVPGAWKVGDCCTWRHWCSCNVKVGCLTVKPMFTNEKVFENFQGQNNWPTVSVFAFDTNVQLKLLSFSVCVCKQTNKQKA